MCTTPHHQEPVMYQMYSVGSWQIPWENTTCSVSHETHQASHPFRSDYYNPPLHREPLNSL